LWKIRQRNKNRNEKQKPKIQTTMLRIYKIKNGYEAIFAGGNLLSFTLSDLVAQLWLIYGFKLPFFIKFNLN